MDSSFLRGNDLIKLPNNNIHESLSSTEENLWSKKPPLATALRPTVTFSQRK